MNTLEFLMKRQAVYTRRYPPAKRSRFAASNAYYKSVPAFKAAPRATMVVPGYTRTVGAFARSRPGAIEKKYFETAIVSTTDMSAGIIVPSLNLVPQGTTDKTRIGNKINVVNLNMNFHFSQDDQTTLFFGNGPLRMIVYHDKQANGAAAVVTDILTTASILSFRNMDQVERFTILSDKLLNSPEVTANVAHTSNSVMYKRWAKKMNIPIHFSSTTGAITELKSSNIGVLLIAAVSTTNWTANCRIKYLDI